MPQTVKALAEAEAYAGPSLVIAYSTCIAHGIDMATSMTHQKDAVDSGYWPLYRFDPEASPRASTRSSWTRKRADDPDRRLHDEGGALRDARRGPIPSAPRS